MRPLLFEQYTNVLKFESQGKCTRYVIGKDEKGSQHSPFPIFQSSWALPASLLPFICSLWEEQEAGQMWAKGSGTAWFLLFLCLKS